MAFNTTPFHGKVARIEKNNVAVDFTDGWELDSSLDMADASRQGQNWKEVLPGMAGATGKFSGSFVAGNTEQKALFDNIIAAAPGTKLTDIKLLLDVSTNAFTGNIYITGLSVPANKDGVVKWSMPFQFDGAVTLTSAA